MGWWLQCNHFDHGSHASHIHHSARTLAAKGKDTHSPPIEHILLRGHSFVSLLIRAAVSEASHLCRYMNAASRENTSNPSPILFLFICTILMSSDSLGNKIHTLHQQRPNAPSSSSAPRPVCHPGWQPRTRQSSERNGWSWRWLYIRGMQSTHFAMRQKSPQPTLQPLLTSLPGIILLWDEIDPLHADHVGENWFQRVFGTYLLMKAANQPVCCELWGGLYSARPLLSFTILVLHMFDLRIKCVVIKTLLLC